MIKLIKNEFRKFSNSYINIVSFAAMLFPVVFTGLVYSFSDGFASTWESYIGSLNLFYGVFLSALIPSFVAIFSIYNEFKEGTMKNLVTAPFSRTQIIISKMLYGSVFIIGLYIAAAILAVVSGILIGLDTSFQNVVYGFKLIIIPGLAAVVFVPLMIYITLVFRNFVAPIIIAFMGTIVGIPIINLGNSYFYPWLIPSNFFFRLGNPDAAGYTLPIVFLIVYIALFFVLSVIKFRRMDFDS